MEGTTGNKRSRLDSDESHESPEAKRFRDDLFNILDDVDDRNETQDLASFMKSFEEEIALPVQASDSGESPKEDLGYLLEASDEELGLPPTASEENEKEKEEEAEELRGAIDSVGFGQIWGLDDQMPCYDFAEINGLDDVLYDGLFDYSDGISASGSEMSEFSWRYESLSAL